MYWISHHIQFHFIRYTDRQLIWINLFYLLLISFVPFATDLVGDHQDLILPVRDLRRHAARAARRCRSCTSTTCRAIPTSRRAS